MYGGKVDSSDRIADDSKAIEGRSHFKQKDPVQIAVDFIAKHEGLRLQAYWDINSWSIGFGTNSYKGEVITKEEAERRLYEAVSQRFEYVKGIDITNEQKASLTSFIYNVGIANAKTVLEYAKRGDHKSVIYLLPQYTTAGGEVLPGLVTRRNAEVSLYKSL